MINTIYASFEDPADAERAAGALLDHGVRPQDISVLQGQKTVEEARAAYENETHFADPINVAVVSPTGAMTGLGTSVPVGMGEMVLRGDEFYQDTEADPEWQAKNGISTTTAADAEEGALKGTAWGAGVGIIAGLASLMVPGVGLVYGAGALAVAIGAAVATTAAGAVAGAVTGYLVDQGVEVNSANRYSSTISQGGALLAVTLPSGPVQEDQARTILEKYGSEHLSLSRPTGYVS
jgi:hypothetical protein